MHISVVTLHNFRSVADATFTFCNYTLLIGANSCGKSNVIDALRIFYEKDLKFEEARDCPKCEVEDEECWIDIEFALTNEEADTVKTEYRLPNNRIKVRKYLKTKEKGTDKKTKQGIYAYIGDQISDEHFYGARNVQQGKFGELIYIPPVSKLDEHTKLSGPSALRDLLTDILKKLVSTSPAFEELTQHFDSFAQRIKHEETNDKRSLNALETEINSGLDGWDVGFRLTINCVNESDIIKNLIGYSVDDPCLKAGLDPSRCGQGFQRHLIFTLIRLAAKYSSNTTISQRNDFTPAFTLLLFEEPEAFLHPPQMDVLRRSLHLIASQAGHQVIASSHSPSFVSHNSDDIPAIVRLRRDQGKTHSAQISAERLKEIFHANQQIAEILSDELEENDEAKEEAEAVNYFMCLNPERCGMFFAGRVLLVEGMTEKMLINQLINAGLINTGKGGVFVLDTIGKHNMHRFMNLLGELHISHSVLHDRDGNGKRHHPLINTLINNSKNTWTQKIWSFPIDIETYLGIQKLPNKDRHRKAHHIMLNYRKGKIDQDKLNEFCGEVTSLTV